jgi:hypothetical protein
VMQLMMRHKQPVPDTLFNFFAAMDEYRYPLYHGLAPNGALQRFPVQFNKVVPLAQSKLFQSKMYVKPDTLAFLNKLAATLDDKEGFIYFFKYKQKREDGGWKIAAIGLLPDDSKGFLNYEINASQKNGSSPFYFSEFTDTVLKETESVDDQLQKIKKRMIYSRKKGGREFYSGNENADFPILFDN